MIKKNNSRNVTKNILKTLQNFKKHKFYGHKKPRIFKIKEGIAENNSNSYKSRRHSCWHRNNESRPLPSPSPSPSTRAAFVVKSIDPLPRSIAGANFCCTIDIFLFSCSSFADRLTGRAHPRDKGLAWLDCLVKQTIFWSKNAWNQARRNFNAGKLIEPSEYRNMTASFICVRFKMRCYIGGIDSIYN